MRRVAFAGIFLIGACCCSSSAGAQCRPGEVWGDLGCRPATQQSIVVRAVKRFRANRAQKKKSKITVPESQRQ